VNPTDSSITVRMDRDRDITSRFDRDCDLDGDSLCPPDDNCPNVYNPRQDDTDGNGVGDACDPICTLVTFDRFEYGVNDSRPPRGLLIDNSAGQQMENLTITGHRRDGTGSRQVVIFDTDFPADLPNDAFIPKNGCVEDVDLGTTNECHGGPGKAKNADKPIACATNDAQQQNILIGLDCNSPVGGDGIIDYTPDDEGCGTQFDINFAEPVRVEYLRVIDIDKSEDACVVTTDNIAGTTTFNAKNILGASVLGDNTVHKLPIGVDDVNNMDVTLSSSGAIDDIYYCPMTPPVQHTLTINIVGIADVMVTPDGTTYSNTDPGGNTLTIPLTFNAGTPVTLDAAETVGHWTFTDWEELIGPSVTVMTSNPSSYAFTMTGDRTVYAVFQKNIIITDIDTTQIINDAPNPAPVSGTEDVQLQFDVQAHTPNVFTPIDMSIQNLATLLPGATLTGTLTSPTTYTLTWPTPVQGTYNLSLSAHDDSNPDCGVNSCEAIFNQASVRHSG